MINFGGRITPIPDGDKQLAEVVGNLLINYSKKYDTLDVDKWQEALSRGTEIRYAGEQNDDYIACVVRKSERSFWITPSLHLSDERREEFISIFGSYNKRIDITSMDMIPKLCEFIAESMDNNPYLK